jgi:thiamine biosynthesis lipoprotein
MRAVVTSLCCCIGWAAVGRAEPPLVRYEFESPHMGTTFRVVLHAGDEATAGKASRAAFARVADLDRIMSDYNPDSELMRLCKANDSEPGKPRPVSVELFAVLEKGQAVSAASDGAFDVTVGPLVRLWRTARRTQRLPDPDELAATKAKVSYRKVTLDPKTRTVALAEPGMRLDLGGIAKGYAADEALAVMRSHGITRALVAASGDITVGDAPPGKAGWDVDIAPIGTGRPARRLVLANAAVSTSGDLFQHVEIGGVRYSHVLDPKTGLGLTGRRSVTVIAPKGVQADSLTKAASVLPPDKALSLIDGTDWAATYIVVKETDDAEEKVTASKRFESFLGKKE